MIKSELRFKSVRVVRTCSSCAFSGEYPLELPVFGIKQRGAGFIAGKGARGLHPKIKRLTFF